MIVLADRRVEVITLFVADLSTSKAFYVDRLELPIVYEDDVSVVVGFANILVNLLNRSEAGTLVAPLDVGAAKEGPSSMLTIAVDDVWATHSRMTEAGVGFLNGPVDQPWGRRTAAFADSDGFVWELAQEI